MHFHHNKRIDKHINDKKRVAAMDWLTLAFALLGGFFHGTYPAFIKAPAVREANVHPIVFQWYKSVCTFVLGLLILAIRAASGHTPVYIFSPWGIASAAAWILSGLCTITAVPKCGVGMTIVLNASTASILSFLVFWLGFDEEVKEHTINGHQIYFAPIFLAALTMGVMGLVHAPGIKFTAILIKKFLWSLVRRMRSSKCQIKKERLLWVNRLRVVNELTGILH